MPHVMSLLSSQNIAGDCTRLNYSYFTITSLCYIKHNYGAFCIDVLYYYMRFYLELKSVFKAFFKKALASEICRHCVL